jgi:8-oxo-dGTP pyrophosphatase MutT (NUDIX family)
MGLTRPLSDVEIAHRLAANRGRALHDPYPPEFFSHPASPAAVLLPLFWAGGDWRLLLIRRACNPGDRHSGQVAFPGGRPEAGDADAAATALREAREEIGLDPARVRMLGRLPAYHTATNYLIEPVVGQIPWPLALRRQPREVSRIFSIPLGWLADPTNRRVEQRRLEQWPEALPVVYFRRYRGERLWGASARISQSLLRVLELAD